MKKPFHTNLEEELIQRFRVSATIKGKHMNEVIAELMEKYISETNEEQKVN
jgi:hypothetical protein